MYGEDKDGHIAGTVLTAGTLTYTLMATGGCCTGTGLLKGEGWLTGPVVGM